MRVLGAVRKIEPADVDACFDELSDDLVAATCRPDRGDNFRVTHVQDSLHRNEERRTIPRMLERIRGRAKRVLVVGTVADNLQFSPDAMLAPDGMLIVLEENAARAAELRSGVSVHAVATRTVIGGDPRRMLYKLAGPFDVIFCNAAYLSLRPMLEKLLATDGVLITNGEP